MKKHCLIKLLFILIFPFSLFSQEYLGSFEDTGFELKILTGEYQRPYFNYKTFSELFGGKDETWEIFGPELFTSYNSIIPFGQNDGSLWQGKGINSKISTGFRFSRYGFSFLLKPDITFSQNLDFKYISPNSAYSVSPYTENAGVYGYYGIPYVDAPQRFGDSSFFDFSWGDSEIRYTWRYFTIGLGTQLIWLGPAKINPILHSNNAPPYPKLDFGIRKTPVTFGTFNVGFFEVRMWVGYLSESSYFDDNSENDHNMISGLSLSYAPSFLPGLIFFINRTYLAPFEYESLLTLPKLLIINLKGGGAQDTWDQRASLGFDYLLPLVQLEIYSEIGLNDYGPSLDGYIRYPFHSLVYTLGLQKALKITNKLTGRVLLEVTNLELSQDFQFQWPSSFYVHHQIRQGYTNSGQWLGAGNGTGGNSQYICFDIFSDNWLLSCFLQRKNPDNDYIYAKSILSTDTEYIEDFRADLTFGIKYSISINNILYSIGSSITQIHNRYYDSISWHETTKDYNLNINFLIKYLF